MADLKITGLSQGTAVLTDVFPYVESPGGVPVTKKETFTKLKTLMQPATYVGATTSAVGTIGLVPAAGTAEVNEALTGGGTYQPVPVVIYSTTLAGTATSIVIGTIPQTYKHLDLIVSARGIGTITSGVELVKITINAATTGYDYSRIDAVGVLYSYDQPKMLVGYASTGTLPAGHYGSMRATFPDYTANKFPVVMSKSQVYSATAPYSLITDGVLRTAGAVATITLTLENGGGTAGTAFAGSTSYTLIGIP